MFFFYFKMKACLQILLFMYPIDVTTVIFIIFWDFLIFYKIFLSPQVKRCAIITCEHGIYELPNDLRN